MTNTASAIFTFLGNYGSFFWPLIMTKSEHLRTLPLPATVVQPSLVFGTAGRSSRSFLRLARLPWLPLPSGECGAIVMQHQLDGTRRHRRKATRARKGVKRDARASD